ncbi:MAG: glycerol-3-phosphate acyltransferase, partial [Rhodospirillaceae bacterium]|nr:glycerol-3-phosphate acyltransferase [Rhodospirillaceae bacterium]
YSSLAALIAALAGPGFVFWLGNWQMMELAAFMAVLVFIRHHQNIRRLFTGAEPRIGAKKTT